MARIPAFFPNLAGDTGQAPEINELRAALPIKASGQWQSFAHAASFMAGHCGSLVVHGMPVDGTAIGIGLSDSFTFTVCQREQVQSRIWMWGILVPPGGLWIGGVAKVDGVEIGSWEASSATEDQNVNKCFWAIEKVASPSSSPTQVIFTIENSNDNEYTTLVTHVLCYSVPLTRLTEYGSGPLYPPDADRLASYAPIASTGGDNGGSMADMAGAAYGVGGLVTETRRSKLFDWYLDAGIVVSSGSFSPMLATSPAVLGRLLYEGETTRTVSVYVRALCTGGDLTGEVKITALSGDSVTIAVTGSSIAMFDGVLDIDCDEYGNDDGNIRGGTRDTLTIEARKTGSTTSITVFAIAIFEE